MQMIPWILATIVVGLLGLLAWDFGRRWLVHIDQVRELAALTALVEANRVRTDKAIANLAAQTQESLTTLEKKQNTLLSGGMLRPAGRSRIG